MHVHKNVFTPPPDSFIPSPIVPRRYYTETQDERGRHWSNETFDLKYGTGWQITIRGESIDFPSVTKITNFVTGEISYEIRQSGRTWKCLIAEQVFLSAERVWARTLTLHGPRGQCQHAA